MRRLVLQWRIIPIALRCKKRFNGLKTKMFGQMETNIIKSLDSALQIKTSVSLGIFCESIYNKTYRCRESNQIQCAVMSQINDYST